MKNLYKKYWNKFLILLNKIDVAYEIVSKMPQPTEVIQKQITFVGDRQMLKRALLKCPCGCSEILNLSLRKNHKPNWAVTIDSKNRVTLSPSVWKNDGCRSHFFVRKSKIIWARD